jgi:dipeptidyl aminopeptidase/acylaminoacyl peptidase
MLRALVFVVVGLLGCGLASAETAATKPIAIETLFDYPHYGTAILSPNTKLLAATAKVGDRMRLIVIDLETQEPKVIASHTDADVVWFSWVNDRRLVYSLAELGGTLDDQHGAGLFAVDADGASPRELMPTEKKQINSAARVYLVRWTTYLARCRGTDDILVVDGESDKDGVYIMRQNTRTGRKVSEVVGIGGNILGGMADPAGILRAVVSEDHDGHVLAWYRPNSETKWEQVARFESLYGTDVWWPAGFSLDGKTMWVSGRIDRDMAAIYAFDLGTKKLGEMVISHPVADIVGDMVFDDNTNQLLGINVDADKHQANWVDVDWARVQATVDNALPGHVNLLSGKAKSLILVYSYSDRDPGRYNHYDVQTGSLAEQLAIRPEVVPSEMAATRMIHYDARDKMSIPAFLTMPNAFAGAKPPLVVLVHGGPFNVRDEWQFHPEVQFLASRGYAVLQPQFRGSTGFGDKLFRAGWKTWGLAMQDDVTDGVKALVNRGLVDPKRVCIMGGSYGGYATAMGLAKDPDLYRCGVDIAGVSDIRLMYSIGYSDFAGTSWAKFGMKDLIGDPEKLKDQFIATSPVEQAGKIKAPLLIAHGAIDARVPIKHAEKLRDALQAAGKQYEWHVYAGEGHGLMKPENKFKFYHAVEAFLDRNLKPAP